MKFFFLITLLLNFLLAQPTVLIIEAKTEDTVKDEAIEDALDTIKSEYLQYNFKRFEISFSSQEDINDLQKYIQNNEKNIVYIVAPKNTSEYKKISTFLPIKVPIITAVGTAMVLDKKDTWVVTTSALSKGKALAIDNIIKKNKITNLFVIFDKEIDQYTQEILEYFNNSKIDIIFEDITRLTKEDFNQENRLVFIASKTSKDTIRIYDEIDKNILSQDKVKNDILLLKVAEKDKAHFNYSNHIYYLSYSIPGYLPDFRLELYDNVSSLCNTDDITAQTCYKVYGKTFQSLYLSLDLGLTKIKQKTSIQEQRQAIYKKLTSFNNSNTYHNKNTKKVMQFKKEKNFYYNSLIENGISNYYIVRLDNNNDSLNHFQITGEQFSQALKSQNTVYIDYKLQNMNVVDLSASAVDLEGIIRLVSTTKNIELNKDFQINFSQSRESDSSVIIIDENEYMQDGKVIFESFYKVKGTFNIDNDLWKFPYDKQKIYLSFSSKDFVNNPFVVQLQNNKDNKLDFGEWQVDYIKPFLSNEIVSFDNNILLKNSTIFYKPVSNLEIQITRNTSLAIMAKFVLPVVIILILILITYISFHKKSTLDSSVDIYVSSFGGIISIYFIFNLLIDIENFILFDAGFLASIILSLSVIVFNTRRYEHGVLKDEFKKNNE